MSSVLFDVPGPRAVARNRIIGAVTILVVLAVLGWVVWRLYATGQFSAEKWNIFTYSAVWVRFGRGCSARSPPSRSPVSVRSCWASSSASAASPSTPGCGNRCGGSSRSCGRSPS